MKKIIYCFIGLLIAIFLSLWPQLFINSTTVTLIYGNLALFALIFLQNGLSVVSWLALCANLTVAPILVQYYTGYSYGLLQLNLIPIYSESILKYQTFYNITMLIGSAVFSISKNEKIALNTLNYDFLTAPSSMQFNNLIAIIFTFIAFPRLSLGAAENSATRFDMLLPGHSWNQLVIVALLLNVTCLNNKSVRYTYAFCISWFFLNGERSDITGLCLGVMAYYFTVVVHKNPKKQFLIALIAVAISYLLLQIGNIRIGNNLDNVNRPFWINLLTFSTISDVGYLLNATFDIINHGLFTHGRTLASNLSQIIPFSKTVYDFPTIISQYYANPGGEPLIAAGSSDFGIWGPAISALIDLIALKLLLLKKNKLFIYEYLLILCSVPRIAWYGRNFVFSAMFFFLPFMIYINFVLDGQSKKIKRTL